MTTRRVEMERFSVVSSKPFQEILASLKSAVGRPDMAEAGIKIARGACPSGRFEVLPGQAGGHDHSVMVVIRVLIAPFFQAHVSAARSGVSFMIARADAPRCEHWRTPAATSAGVFLYLV